MWRCVDLVITDVAFWDVALRGSGNNRRFEGMHCLHHQGEKNQ
jgi:hypothetical protein